MYFDLTELKERKKQKMEKKDKKNRILTQNLNNVHTKDDITNTSFLNDLSTMNLDKSNENQALDIEVWLKVVYYCVFTFYFYFGYFVLIFF